MSMRFSLHLWLPGISYDDADAVSTAVFAALEPMGGDHFRLGAERQGDRLDICVSGFTQRGDTWHPSYGYADVDAAERVAAGAASAIVGHLVPCNLGDYLRGV